MEGKFYVNGRANLYNGDKHVPSFLEYKIWQLFMKKWCTPHIIFAHNL
jgi:hypothetical protein